MLLPSVSRHGDMLFLFRQQTAGARPGSSDSVPMDTTPFTSDIVKENEVDLLLYKEDGKIHRKRDEQLWVHPTLWISPPVLLLLLCKYNY